MPAELQPAFEKLAPRIFYWPGDVTDPASMESLSTRLYALPGAAASGRLFCLSLWPSLFPVVVGART